MNMAAGRSGVAFSAIASLYDNETGSYKTNEARVELQLTDRNAKGYFSALKVEQDAIERELGYSLTWHNPPESRTSRIYTRRPADLKNEASWPELYQWMQGRLEEFHRVFGPRIKRMIPISSTNEGHVS